jgi:RNA recognition motif-containing protein
MQRRIYVGGLPWEFDRISLVNYLKAILECNDIEASFEPEFINPKLENPNAAVRVTDVFVAINKETKQARGFGFITLEIDGENAEELFNKIVELLNGRVVLGIRGPRTLIVNEADPREETNKDNGNFV